MSERPPEQRALFDRALKAMDASKALTPATVEDVEQLSDLDAALSLVMVLCADIEHATKHARIYCGHCRVPGDEDAGRFDTVHEVKAHLVKCPQSPLVHAVLAALNALDAYSAGRITGTWTQEMQHAYDTALEALRRMVGR